MKIAILTFWTSNDNYGQQLQAYALQTYLRQIGHDAFLINYTGKKPIKTDSVLLRILKCFNPYKFYTVINNRILKKRIQKKEEKQYPRYFDDFRKKYFVFSNTEYNSLKDLKEVPPEADAYIVGSDQVWNTYNLKPKYALSLIKLYFLDFGLESVRRFAYAASWGQRDVSEKVCDCIRPFLNKFKAIGVREESGIKICEKCGNTKAVWTKDPTLLLSAEHYRKLYKESVVENKKEVPYILFYYLDNGGEFDKEKVYNFAIKNNLTVKYVSGNNNYDDYSKIYPTIQEWLSLVDNAAYIITNSFHCCVFSILFEKKFAAIKMTGKNEAMNERLFSLFKLCKIKSRFITNDDYDSLTNEVEKASIPEDNFLGALNEK